MSPKSLILATSLLAAGAVTSLPAAAAQGDQPAAPQLPIRAQVIFNLIDVNSDGFIDQTEVAALQRAIFASIDADSDAKLSKEEFSQIAAGGERAGRHGRFMRGGPRGGDMGPRLNRGPRGGDMGPRGDRHGQMQPGDMEQGPGQGFGPGGMMQAPQTGTNEPMPDDAFGGPIRDFAALDIDGDGVISIEEFAIGGPSQPGQPQ